MAEILDNMENDPNTGKQRHGCVTAWLILMIVASGLTAVTYFLGAEMVSNSLPSQPSPMLIYVIGLLAIVNVICAVLLFQWKRNRVSMAL